MIVTPARPASIPEGWTTLNAVMSYNRYYELKTHINETVPKNEWVFASLAAETWSDNGRRDCLTVRFKGYFARADVAFDLKLRFG